jgi:cell division protein FtsW (lipid II flippase)
VLPHSGHLVNAHTDFVFAMIVKEVAWFKKVFVFCKF